MSVKMHADSGIVIRNLVTIAPLTDLGEYLFAYHDGTVQVVKVWYESREKGWRRLTRDVTEVEGGASQSLSWAEVWGHRDR